MEEHRTYIAIDLKSFYASVECIERGLDPLTTNLTVADESRTEKTICLAVSPSLKAYGVGGRCRLFELIQKVKEANVQRKWNAPRKKLIGESYNDIELKNNPLLAISYIIAPPQMAHYMAISTKIVEIYLKYISVEDIHVYSIDEVFIDATAYLKLYNLSAHDFAMKLIRDVLRTTGITATAGIGSNMYLCKVAMDIVAKKMPADKDGVRIAELDEMSYRQKLWEHTPLTDFWRVGHGYADKLGHYGIHTMGDIARMSEKNEEFFYKLFGINAELLIDHAWGWEPTTIAEIKAYKPTTNSLSSGQVLSRPYPYEQAKTIVHEMIDLLSLDLVEKRLMTNQVVLDIGYDIENEKYSGEYTTDHYGRKVPKHAHRTENIPKYTSSTNILTEATLSLFERVINKELNVRRVTITVCHLLAEKDAKAKDDTANRQISFFDNPQKEAEEQHELERERRVQDAILEIRKKYGKNAVLKGVNYQEGATTIERNGQIGGHKARKTNAVRDVDIHECAVDEIKLAYEVRKKVFVKEQGVDEAIELDEMDSVATHLICIMNGKPIGAGRFYIEDSKAHLGRICVLASYRQLGIGSKICNKLLSLAWKKGCIYAELNSQLHAVEFYKKLGFIPVDDVFIEAGIEHIKMVKKMIY